MLVISDTRERAEPSVRRDSILVIDDDVELCRLLGEYLQKHAFHVTCAHDGLSGLRSALSDSYDIVVLDVMLPLIDGFEVLRQLRLRSEVPVVMLTARAGERDRIFGLEGGADDYLPKPFAPRELLARIRAVTRRHGHAALAGPSELRAGSLRLNTDTGEACIGSRALDLTSTESSILGLLLHADGRIVSRDAISAVLHHRESTPYERSVDVHISHLRRKLGPEFVGYIHTVRGVGYRCAVPQ